METSLVRKICENLIACAIQRCRLSDNLCRLSIALKCFYESDPPSVFISISDTGAGSSLAEFRELDCWSDHDCAEKWDGMLSITTTRIDDNHIYRYILSLKEAAGAVKRLTKLPPTSKKGKFSGTEVRLSPPIECCRDFVAWMTCFCRKILVLKAPRIATEFTVEHVNNIGSKCERILQTNHGSFLPHSMPNIECLISGLEDYVLKHEHILDKECQSCFLCRENLKVGSGAASSTDVLKDTGQMVEAVIVVAEAQKSVDMLCSRSFSPATEVLYFQDFSPCQIPWSTFEALTSIDWQSYGLTLKSNAVNGDGHATLEWDNLPPSTHIAIVLHSYNKKVMASQSRKKNSAYRNVIRKAIKLALDNLKAKYMGLFLSPHALKIRGCAPDLSRAIAGLISSSNDSHFQKECASTLGLCPLEVLKEGKVESCIREKIIGIIEMNDRKSKSKGGGECAPCLFECESFNEDDYPGEENEEVEEDVSMLNL